LHTEGTVLLEGHTDNVGSDEQNFSLSRRRAAAVKTYLVERGLDPARLQTDGVGESDPVASNATAIGRRQNRNVAVIVRDETK
jgi:OOP family OmpA-OmpF porin